MILPHFTAAGEYAVDPEECSDIHSIERYGRLDVLGTCAGPEGCRSPAEHVGFDGEPDETLRMDTSKEIPRGWPGRAFGTGGKKRLCNIPGSTGSRALIPDYDDDWWNDTKGTSQWSEDELDHRAEHLALYKHGIPSRKSWLDKNDIIHLENHGKATIELPIIQRAPRVYRGLLEAFSRRVKDNFRKNHDLGLNVSQCRFDHWADDVTRWMDAKFLCHKRENKKKLQKLNSKEALEWQQTQVEKASMVFFYWCEKGIILEAEGPKESCKAWLIQIAVALGAPTFCAAVKRACV